MHSPQACASCLFHVEATTTSIGNPIEPTPVKKNKTSKLSKAEIEKLKKVTETSAVDNKGNEIPEYLTSEYSK